MYATSLIFWYVQISWHTKDHVNKKYKNLLLYFLSCVLFVFSGADIGECGSATDAGTKEGPHHAKTSVAPSLETLPGKISSWTGAFYSHMYISFYLHSNFKVLVFNKFSFMPVLASTDVFMTWICPWFLLSWSWFYVGNDCRPFSAVLPHCWKVLQISAWIVLDLVLMVEQWMTNCPALSLMKERSRWFTWHCTEEAIRTTKLFAVLLFLDSRCSATR